MGFFSKKTYVCEKCGNEFEKRVNLNGSICDKCRNEKSVARRELEMAVNGYLNYHADVFNKNYTEQEMRSIIDHRERLLNKLKNNGGINREELETISSDYNSLTEKQKEEFLVRVANSTIGTTYGAAYAGKFFCLTQYDEVIIDVEDVFAVGFTSDSKMELGNIEAILCAVFTNDSYIPVFPMVLFGEKGVFDMKSKKGREMTVALFEKLCPNLTYPVGDIKQLKKQIKQDGSVKGKVDIKFMLEQISNAEIGFGIFNTKKMDTSLYEETVTMLDGIGYIADSVVNEILQMDRKANKKFWDGEFKKLWETQVELNHIFK